MLLISTMCACRGQGGGGSLDGPGGAGGGARAGSKGLRHFSMKVCEKVESKQTTTYNEVADELVAELPLTNTAGAVQPACTQGCSWDALRPHNSACIAMVQRLCCCVSAGA